MTIAYEKFADEAFVKIFRMTPEVIGAMGLSNLPEFSGMGGKLNDYSLEGGQQRQELLAEAYKQHQAYDYDALTDAEQLSYKVFEFFLQYMPFEPWVGLAGDEFSLYAYPVCHHDGAPAETFNLLVNFHDVETVEDAENYLARLAALPIMFTELERGLRYRHERQLSPPKSALKILIGEIHSLIEQGPDYSDLLTSFDRKLRSADGISEKQSHHYCQAACDIITPFYQSNLASFLTCLEAIHMDADDTIGALRFDRGEAYYQYCLIRQTTTYLKPREIYQLGEIEVSRLKGELIQDVEALGFSGVDLKENIAEALQKIIDDNNDTAQNREEILSYYRKLVKETEKKMRPYFNLYPKAPCIVNATQRHLEQGRTTTYYPPSATGEYPGVFELNLKRELNKPTWSRNALAYHEAYPGHHLQLSLAQELTHLPLFRRTFVNGGYLEGWAKYAERLPFETGVDKDARYEMERKVTELLSTSNLMLDVGIHIFGWSRQKAIAFSMEQALIEKTMAEYMVDRITVTPGQTTAYVLGLLKVRQLRENSRERLGDKFTLASFHDAILGEGALPLDLLEQNMSRPCI